MPVMGILYVRISLEVSWEASMIYWPWFCVLVKREGEDSSKETQLSQGAVAAG